MAVQKEKDAALHHAYVPVHTHCAIFTERSLPRSPSKAVAEQQEKPITQSGLSCS